MNFAYRFLTTAVGALLISLLITSNCYPQETDFAARQEAIKERFDRNPGNVQNRDVHDPPMIDAQKSDLDDAEAVIGVALDDEARAYPLTMLFGGGGIFELLNDNCGCKPIAVSW